MSSNAGDNASQNQASQNQPINNAQHEGDEKSAQLPPTDRPLRTIKSFVRRQGRMTPSQEKGFEQFADRYLLHIAGGRIDPVSVFGRSAPLILEIGIGNGDTLLHLAERDSAHDHIGIEVHRPGVGRVMGEAGKRGLTNMHVFGEDAIEVLKQCIPDGSLDGVLLFFPDPWHKKKHNKRRIVQADFAALVHSKLKPGGYLHMATDWEAYALHMMDIMSAAPGYVNQAGAGQYLPRPEGSRPVTRF
jgi:tRNA (guanine-N7-)-methyltransferase